MDRFAQLCLWADESISLCQQLQELLVRERNALIALKGDELAETTMSKEATVARILAIRRKIREAGKSWYAVESSSGLEGKLEPARGRIWAEKHARWQREWEATRGMVERNQRFLKHSQRNLGRLVEHWRAQLGETPLYSAKGMKVDAPATGKVFQAKY